MNRRAFTFYIFFFGVGLSAFAQETRSPKIFFKQGDDSMLIKNTYDSVYLKRAPFSLTYFARSYDAEKENFYAAQIALLATMPDLRLLESGNDVKNILFFEPGSGMAPGESNTYDTAFINSEGHHYLYYESEKDKRVTLIEKGRTYNRFEWPLWAIRYNEQDLPFSDLKIPAIFFVIFIDDNLNGKIDERELNVVKVGFL